MDKLTILIVDDARSERILLRHALTDVRRDLTIYEAADRFEAVECLQKHSIDLVFLDIQLPGDSGIEILAELLELSPGIDVVMVSHHSTQDLVVGALRLGARGYIVKPFNLARLRETLSQYGTADNQVDV